MKHVIWVVGVSASGKETFIKYLSTNPDSEILKKLNFQNKKISVCKESIDYIGQYNNDPENLRRNFILDSVPQILNETDIALVKWQYVDSEKKLPEKLKGLLPNAKHSIILLEVDNQELQQRLPNKSWWKKDLNLDDWINREQMAIKSSAKEFQDEGFEVIKVNTNTQNYILV